MREIVKSTTLEDKVVDSTVVSREITGGKQMILRFKNDYGVSIIQNVFSYGGSEGLYELAVIKLLGEKIGDFKLVSEGDVVGRLTQEEALSLAERVAEFPKAM